MFPAAEETESKEEEYAFFLPRCFSLEIIESVKKNSSGRDYSKINFLHQSNGDKCYFCYTKKISIF